MVHDFSWRSRPGLDHMPQRMADELFHVKQVKNRLVSLQYFDIRLFPTTGDDPKSKGAIKAADSGQQSWSIEIEEAP
jgi:hypothetical protein